MYFSVCSPVLLASWTEHTDHQFYPVLSHLQMFSAAYNIPVSIFHPDRLALLFLLEAVQSGNSETGIPYAYLHQTYELPV